MFNLTCFAFYSHWQKGLFHWQDCQVVSGLHSNPRFCLLLYEQKEVLVITDFIQWILARAHTYTFAAASAHWLLTKAQIWWRFAMCSSALLKFVSTFHTTGVTHQLCLKPYYTSLHWWVHYFSPHSHQLDLCTDKLKANSLKPKLPHVWTEKASQKSVLPMQCHCKLFEALNALPMQFSLYMKQTLKQMCCSFKSVTRKSQIALNHITTNTC